MLIIGFLKDANIFKFSKHFPVLTMSQSARVNIWFLTLKILKAFFYAGKAIALTRWSFVGKVMSLLFNILYNLVIAFFQGASIS